MLIHRIGGALVFGALASAQGTRVSGPLAQPVAGQIEAYRATSDGARVVYAADQDKDEIVELFVAPSDGGKGPRRISPPLPSELDVVPRSLRLSPDDRWAVFQVEDELGNGRVWSARLDATTPPAALALEVGTFEIDPTSTWVVLHDWDSRLFRVPIDGSAPPATLSEPGHDVRGMVFTPRGERVVYVAQPDVPFYRRELFSVPLDGSAPPVRLSGPMVPSGAVEGGSFAGPTMLVTPDGTRVVYRADQEVDGRYELFSAPIDGSQAPVKLSGTLVPGGDVAGEGLVSAFQLSSDGTFVVYRAEEHVLGVRALYYAPVDGSGPSVPLTPVRATSRSAGRYRISPDGEWVVFTAELRRPGVVELFRASRGGRPGLTRLSAPLVAGGDVDDGNDEFFDATWAFEISADSRWVVYLADQEVDGRFELYRVPLRGRGGARGLDGGLAPGAPVKLNPPLGEREDVTAFELSADGSSCVFTAGRRLFRADLATGGPAVHLDAPLHARSAVSSFELADARAIYLGDQWRDQVAELFAVPLDRSAAPARINADLPLGPVVGDVTTFDFSPDGRWILYTADGEFRGSQELYSTPVDARGAPRKLHGPLAERGGGVSRFRVLGEQVFFLATLTDLATQELLHAPLDASRDAEVLSGPLVAGGSVKQFAPTADGGRVVYLADQDTDGTDELFSVPTDGSAGPRRLHAPYAVSQRVVDFALTPDGTSVVYLASQDTPLAAEVYVVPADGSRAPRKASALLPSGSSVSSFLVAPDGQRVVYRAGPNVGRVDLFSAPVDGSLAAELLTSTASASARVSEYELSPDSRWVVFRSNQDRPSLELFSAPADASAPPVKLNRPGASALDSFSLTAITPDSRRAVFAARDPAVNRFGLQLYAAPLDGSANPELLSTPDQEVQSSFLGAGGTRALYWTDRLWSVPVDGSAAPIAVFTPPSWSFVADFAPAPSSAAVLVVADLRPGVHELFQVSATAAVPPRRVSASFPPFGDMASSEDGWVLAFSPDASRVLYRADQERNEVFELYLSRLEPGTLAPAR